MKAKFYRKNFRLPRRPEWGKAKFIPIREWAGAEPTRKVIVSALLLLFVVLVQRADFSAARRLEAGIRYVITARIDYAPVLQRLQSVGSLTDRLRWPLLPAGPDIVPEDAAADPAAGASPAELEARVRERGLTAPLAAEVTSGYGPRLHPVDLEERLHTGIDLGAATGAPVAAALDGIVSEVSEDEILGKTIVINHGDGIETVYAHCSETTAGAGQYVRSGDTIAYVGETGQTDGPHLHFEVRVDGTPIDPSRVLDG
ncbi:MAG: M23 family metallopeptidase [bacterium]